MPIRITRQKRKAVVPQHGRRADAKSLAAIQAAGWTHTHNETRHVASKRVIEEDHSITWKFESSYTLEGLARNVARRERES